MAEQGASFLPPVTQTVNMGLDDQQIEDPLAYMQQFAREMIESVNKHSIVNAKEKKDFKTYVLKAIKVAIDEMKVIDAEKEKADAEKAKEETPEEDELDSLFEDTEAEDEYLSRKKVIAAKFVYDLKIYKSKFLNEVRKKREHSHEKKEAKLEEEILKQLEKVKAEENDGITTTDETLMP